MTLRALRMSCLILAVAAGYTWAGPSRGGESGYERAAVDRIGARLP
jgi:hypothetical protein